jgi:hypothetical protein
VELRSELNRGVEDVPIVLGYGHGVGNNLEAATFGEQDVNSGGSDLFTKQPLQMFNVLLCGGTELKAMKLSRKRKVIDPLKVDVDVRRLRRAVY